jgi:omega-hydroxy-beta-dihydromenaquinone-9 sulfotransferase
MNYIPFIPLIRLTGIIIRNGGLSAKGILHLLPWLLKTILLEPLRLTEVIIYERKIQAHSIKEPPIFILGHYRSGTTYLQRLFMQDKRLGYLSIFQSVLPELMLCFEDAFTPALNFISSIFKIKNPFHRIPFTWHFPGEDDVAMTALCSPHGAQWGMLFPRSLSRYTSRYMQFSTADAGYEAAWKNDYRYLLKKVSLKNKGRRLVLKSPPNTARIKELLELFPGATFIHIHRAPAEVFASAKKFWQVILSNYALGKTAGLNINETILQHYENMMERNMTQRSLVPASQWTSISYDELVTDAFSVMYSIYYRTGIYDFDECREAVRDFISAQSGYQRLSHQLSEEEAAQVKQRVEKFSAGHPAA